MQFNISQRNKWSAFQKVGCLLFCLLLVMAAVTGCSLQSTKEETITVVDWMQVDKYARSLQVQETVPIENMDLYQAVYDAIDKVEAEVDISQFGASKQEIKSICKVLWDKGNAEFFYLGEMPTLSEDGSKLKFTYFFSKDESMNRKSKFAVAVNHILNDVVKPNATELQKEFSIYNYLLKNCTYNYDSFDNGLDISPQEFMKLGKEEQENYMKQLEEIDQGERYNSQNAYSVLVNKKGICFGFAGALNFLYNKLGIDCRILTPVQEGHAWNMIKINGKYYHLDLTFDVDSKSLQHFNMTDAERQLIDHMRHWKEAFLEERRDPKVCDSADFDYLRSVKSYELNEKQTSLQFTDLNDGKTYRMGIDGTNKELVS